VTAVKRRIREVIAATWESNDRRRRGYEGTLVALPDPEPVEAELLGQPCVVQDLLEALRRRLLFAGDGVRSMHDERDRQELHIRGPIACIESIETLGIVQQSRVGLPPDRSVVT
jgi:hypothetical protein